MYKECTFKPRTNSPSNNKLAAEHYKRDRIFKSNKVKEFLIKMGKSDGKFIDSEKKWLENIKKILLI